MSEDNGIMYVDCYFEMAVDISESYTEDELRSMAADAFNTDKPQVTIDSSRISTSGQTLDMPMTEYRIVKGMYHPE